MVFVEIGIAMPFMPLWLDGLRLDPTVIGLLLALPIATRIAATRPLMGLIDRGVGPRTLLLAGSLALAATYALMPGGAGLGWPVLALLVLLNAVAGAPLVPSIDYLTLAAVRRRPGLDYARIRRAGSVAFLAASIAGGALLTLLGGQVAVPLLLTGLALLASLVAYASRDVAPAQAAAATRAPPPLPRRLRLLIAAAAAVQASHAAIYGFASIHWIALGLSTATVGALWGVGVVAEIALFSLVGSLPPRWRAPERMLALGAGAALVRAVGLSLAGGDLAVLVPLQALHGLTFGATQLGAMAAVSAFAPDGARGRAQGTLSAAVATISAAATLASGVAYRVGGPAVFALMAPLALTGLGLVRAAHRAGPPAAALREDTKP